MPKSIKTLHDMFDNIRGSLDFFKAFHDFLFYALVSSKLRNFLYIFDPRDTDVYCLDNNLKYRESTLQIQQDNVFHMYDS